jgi:hypothetical protein
MLPSRDVEFALDRHIDNASQSGLIVGIKSQSKK